MTLLTNLRCRAALTLAAAASVGWSAGCVEKLEGCEYTGTCPPSIGGSAGQAGSPDSGGSGGTATLTGGATSTHGGAGGTTTSSQGGTSNGGAGGTSGGTGGTTTATNTEGTSGGSGGAGGAGGAPCDEACEGETPFCDEASDTCVECRETVDCTEGVCDPEAHQCVECLDSAQHCEAPTPLCDNQHSCVECLETNDCTESTASWCDDNSCAPCQTNDHCSHLTDTPVCDVGTGECVECTGTDYASCGVNEDDEPLVCDSLTRTCSDDQVEHGSNTCEPCISDAHCPLGRLCVEQIFSAESVGYFCHWVEGDTEHGAPAVCNSSARPYVERLVDAVSIDSQVATVCGLAVSTCPARTAFRTKNCAPEGTPDDSLCGFDPPNDAKCAQFSPDEYRCTMRCLSFDDCPGTDCDTGPLEPVCEL